MLSTYKHLEVFLVSHSVSVFWRSRPQDITVILQRWHATFTGGLIDSSEIICKLQSERPIYMFAVSGPKDQECTFIFYICGQKSVK